MNFCVATISANHAGLWEVSLGVCLAGLPSYSRCPAPPVFATSEDLRLCRGHHWPRKTIAFSALYPSWAFSLSALWACPIPRTFRLGNGSPWAYTIVVLGSAGTIAEFFVVSLINATPPYPDCLPAVQTGIWICCVVNDGGSPLLRCHNSATGRFLDSVTSHYPIPLKPSVFSATIVSLCVPAARCLNLVTHPGAGSNGSSQDNRPGQSWMAPRQTH
jgi:hypothetical protein